MSQVLEIEYYKVQRMIQALRDQSFNHLATSSIYLLISILSSMKTSKIISVLDHFISEILSNC